MCKRSKVGITVTLNWSLSYRVLQICTPGTELYARKTHILVIAGICTLHPSACTLRFQVSGSESRDTIFSFGYSNMAANEFIITVPQNELRQFLKGVEVFDRAEVVRKGREVDKTTSHFTYIVHLVL